MGTNLESTCAKTNDQMWPWSKKIILNTRDLKSINKGTGIMKLVRNVTYIFVYTLVLNLNVLDLSFQSEEVNSDFPLKLNIITNYAIAHLF